MDPYPQLFSPFQIGNVSVRNRVYSGAHPTHYSKDGADSQRDLDYQVQKAKGGIGLLIVGNKIVHALSPNPLTRFAWANKEGVAADRRITSAVKDQGAAIFAQLNHFGANGGSEWIDDLRVNIGPTARRSLFLGEISKAMEIKDIHEVVEAWAASAGFVREGGFDGVELMLAHGHLFQEFLSPLYNTRADEYGGTLANRFRIVLETIAAVRNTVGSDFVVGVRIPVSEFTEGGLDNHDSILIAQMLEATGQIDYVNFSGGGSHNSYWAVVPSDMQGGQLIELAANVKQSIGLPVLAGGGFVEAAEAEQVIASGQADLVGMTRAHIADPLLLTKVAEGREDEIVHCIRCNQACAGRLFKSLPIGCTVNPETGREARFATLRPAAARARWVVVGGGPAGMKAAGTLAERGHDVVLLEQNDHLGGQVDLILRGPRRDSFATLTSDLERRLKKFGVDVRLETTATPELVQSLSPDGVIVATGALPGRSGFSTVASLRPELPGWDQENVLTAWDLLLGSRSLGARSVVLEDDGTRYAAGVTELAVEQCVSVQLVSSHNALFPQTTFDRPLIYGRLLGTSLVTHLNSWASKFEGTTLTVYNLYTGAETVLEDIDSLILVTAPEANDSLYHALKGAVDNLHRIGDCVAPRKLDHAIYEGFTAGSELWSYAERYFSDGELERWRTA